MISVGNRLCDITNVVNMCNNNDQLCGLDTSVLGTVCLPCGDQWGGGLWPRLPKHSPDWESARKRGQATHHHQLSFVTREQCEYKRGETRTFPQSPLSQHRQQSLRHVAASYPGGGRIEDLRNRTRDGASQLTEAGPLPVMGGRVELLQEYRRHHTQRWILLEDSSRLHIMGHYQ